MKDKIRQILRQFRSKTNYGDPKMLKALYQYMNFITKDYRWYSDTPEQRFVYTTESIWLINPETKEWVVELKKDGKLWWYMDFYLNFKRYFNITKSEYEKFITIWVEDILNIGVSATVRDRERGQHRVEDVLKNGKELK